MIYVDELMDWGPSKGVWCHCWSDGHEEELDSFAAGLGLKKSYAQRGGTRKWFYHYDLRPSRRALAIKNGAQPDSLVEYVKKNRPELP